jgi:hypothetical protein
MPDFLDKYIEEQLHKKLGKLLGTKFHVRNAIELHRDTDAHLIYYISLSLVPVTYSSSGYYDSGWHVKQVLVPSLHIFDYWQERLKFTMVLNYWRTKMANPDKILTILENNMHKLFDIDWSAVS